MTFGSTIVGPGINQAESAPPKKTFLSSRRRASNRALAARYDAAQTTAENAIHWGMADSLSADSALNEHTRHKIRIRSRYEVANNCYAGGLVRTLADAVIGPGPRLQVRGIDTDDARRIENAWAAWCRATGFARKLWRMRYARAESGEVFGVLATNRAVDHAVKLDMRLIEADQVTDPVGTIHPEGFETAEGIVFDQFGNPIEYLVLKRHPGSLLPWLRASQADYDAIPAADVIHYFDPTRPGQIRGLPELTPALELFAVMRRYTLATAMSAENAANLAGVIENEMIGDEGFETEPLETIEIPRASWLNLLPGQKISQLRSEQPVTQYPDFIGQTLREVARVLQIPYGIAAGDFSQSNYSSARADRQGFDKSIEIQRSWIESEILNRVFAAWFDLAVLTEGVLPESVRTLNPGIRLEWFWSGFGHVDPLKEANAAKVRIESRVSSMSREYARQGLDWETEFEQIARERRRMSELGIDQAAAMSRLEQPGQQKQLEREGDDDDD